MTAAEQLATRRASDPHAFLGAHPDGDKGLLIRAFRPDAKAVYVRTAGGRVAELSAKGTDGLFEGTIPDATLPYEYQLEVEYETGTFTVGDPYRFCLLYTSPSPRDS